MRRHVCKTFRLDCRNLCVQREILFMNTSYILAHSLAEYVWVTLINILST